ncbi:PCMT domain containing protein [Trichuris trichiura]|uniref:PCMT domain containing protein n=1 Tax=Trichuris trichiura TaxID=36087 RepID=A0A077ZBH2_TRITR|nr:PCMT domain containing protein [Trichuris trichiura]
MGSYVSSTLTNHAMVDRVLLCTEMRTADEIAMRSVDRRLFLPEECVEPYSLDPVTCRGMVISSPRIYAEVLKHLQLEPGDHFLNVGSGSGYFSCIAGILVANGGINVGLEIKPGLVEYSKQCVSQMLETCSSFRLLGFVPPQFYCGNLLNVEEIFREKYFNKIYCGFELNSTAIFLLSEFLRPNGILVTPWLRRVNQNLRVRVSSYSFKLNVVKKTADSSIAVTNVCPTVFDHMIISSSNSVIPADISCMPSLYKIALWELHRLVIDSVLQHYPKYQHYYSGRMEVDCAALRSSVCKKKQMPKRVKNEMYRLDKAPCGHVMAWECHETMKQAVVEDFEKLVQKLPIPEKLRRSLLFHS